MQTVKDIGVSKDCYNIAYYLLELYNEDVCNLLDQDKFTPNHAQQLVGFMHNIVTSPACSFERRKCQVYSLIANIKKMFSSKTPLFCSFTKDDNGIEYFFFIGTIGLYAIDLAMYTEITGRWIVLTDGSCIRNCKGECYDLTYTISRRKQDCALCCEDYAAIDKENDKCYIYDAKEDKCTCYDKTCSEPTIHVRHPTKCQKVCCCFRLVLDILDKCDKYGKGCSLNIETGDKGLPKDHKIRIKAKQDCGTDPEVLGEFSSLGHFIVNLCNRDCGYYEIIVELVAIIPGGEGVVSSDSVWVYVYDCDKDSCCNDKDSCCYECDDNQSCCESDFSDEQSCSKDSCCDDGYDSDKDSCCKSDYSCSKKKCYDDCNPCK